MVYWICKISMNITSGSSHVIPGICRRATPSHPQAPPPPSSTLPPPPFPPSAAMYKPTYPPSASPAALTHLLDTLKDHSLANGLTVRPPPHFTPNPHNSVATHAPVSLFPSLYPRHSFNLARDVQTAYNNLYALVSADTEFLTLVTEELAKVDDFISQLFEIWKRTQAEGSVQPYSLGLFRSDYMLHQPPHHSDSSHDDFDAVPKVQQVEFNTIASSFGGLATKVSELHRFLIQSRSYPEHEDLKLENVPRNPAAEGLAAGLAAGHEAYGVSEAAVLFIVQPGERNVFDQRAVEYPLLNTHGVRTHRVTLEEAARLCQVDEENNRRLLFKPKYLETPVEISVVYFRSGYSPDDYPTPATWEARELLERSKAIKCPTISTHLAGSKKVQQVLTIDGILERFLPSSPLICAKLRETFTGIHPLDSTPMGLAARNLALTHPERYVLKPQREGGGNNVYREDIPGFLKELEERDGNRDGWAGYVLMEMIRTPVAKGVVVREGTGGEGWVVGELGVYGVGLWREGGNKGEGKGVVMEKNEEVGWLLRTKGRESNEGGVAAGFGCVDGVCLVD